MKATRTYLAFFLLLALFTLDAEWASGQIIDPNPPPFFPEHEQFRVGGTVTTKVDLGLIGQEYEVEVELTGEDIKEFWGSLWGWLTGGGDTDGGGGGDDPGDDTGDDTGGDTGSTSSSSLQENVDVQNVKITRNRIVISMGNRVIHRFSTNKYLEVPPAFLQHANIKQSKYIPAGTYERSGRKLVLPLKNRKRGS